jgi:hypothetical protein
MKGTVPPVGQVFDRLTVIGPGKKKYHWLCLCSCGNTKEINKFHIGVNIKSCGCLLAEWAREGQKTHGKRKNPTYEIWSSMKQRCLNPGNKDYCYYGGRGINVCAEWMNFQSFIDDMGECPSGYSIERININMGYCKENCVWIKRSMQNRNKRNNRLLTYNQKTQSVIEWSEETGIPYQTLLSRLKRGWEVDRALSNKKGG